MNIEIMTSQQPRKLRGSEINISYLPWILFYSILLFAMVEGTYSKYYSSFQLKLLGIRDSCK